MKLQRTHGRACARGIRAVGAKGSQGSRELLPSHNAQVAVPASITLWRGARRALREETSRRFGPSAGRPTSQYLRQPPINMKYAKLRTSFAAVAAVAALASCGGGGGGGGDAPAPPPAPAVPVPPAPVANSAAACFSADSVRTGARIEQIALDTISAEVGGRITGGGTATITLRTTVDGPATFNGTPAIQSTVYNSFRPDALLAASGFPSFEGTSLSFFSHDPAAFVVRQLGSIADPTQVADPAAAGALVSGRSVVAYQPAIERRYTLSPGESYTQTYQARSQAFIPPRTDAVNSFTTTTTETIKYIGRTTVTVPAGTFEACEYVTDTRITAPGALQPSIYNEVSWVGVGNGQPLKSIVRAPQAAPANSVSINTLELLSASIDGKPVTP